MEGSCEYIQQTAADSRRGAVLQLGGWEKDRLLTVKKTVFHETQGPRIWADSLERPRQRKMDVILDRF